MNKIIGTGLLVLFFLFFSFTDVFQIEVDKALLIFCYGSSGASGARHSSPNGTDDEPGWRYSDYGPNVIDTDLFYGEAESFLDYATSGDMAGRFVLANTSTVAVTDSVPQWGAWLDNGNDTVVLTVYDPWGDAASSVSAGGQELVEQGRRSSNASGASGMQTFNVYSSGTISACADGGPCDDIQTVARLSADETTVSIPEPSTLLIMGGGMLGFAALKKMTLGG